MSIYVNKLCCMVIQIIKCSLTTTMYLFTLIKYNLIANDFSIERCRDMPMNTRAPVCTFLLCNLPKCVVPNSKQHVGSPRLLIETSLCLHVLNIENFSLNVRKHQMLFDRILQAAMGLLDGVEKWAIPSAWSYDLWFSE